MQQPHSLIINTAHRDDDGNALYSSVLSLSFATQPDSHSPMTNLSEIIIIIISDRHSVESVLLLIIKTRAYNNNSSFTLRLFAMNNNNNNNSSAIIKNGDNFPTLLLLPFLYRLFVSCCRLLLTKEIDMVLI